jgi:hypothetical protein
MSGSPIAAAGVHIPPGVSWMLVLIKHKAASLSIFDVEP